MTTPDDVIPRSRPPRTPRWLWVVSLALGAACAIAFVVSLVRGGDASSSGAAPAASSPGGGFSVGLVVGALAGLAVGWFAHAHSSRRRP